MTKAEREDFRRQKARVSQHIFGAKMSFVECFKDCKAIIPTNVLKRKQTLLQMKLSKLNLRYIVTTALSGAPPARMPSTSLSR